MFVVIGIMLAGMLLGYCFKSVAVLQRIGKTISWTILLLLFLLGVSVGSNDAIVKNLYHLGWQAMLIAVAGTLGSVIAAWAVYRYLSKESKEE